PAHLQHVLKQLLLREVPRQPVEHEELGLGVEVVDVLHPLHVLLPQVDRELIRHQLPPPGILLELAPDRAGQVERAKDVAGRAVREARNRPDDLPLRPLAAAGGAEEQDGLVAVHEPASLTEWRSAVEGASGYPNLLSNSREVTACPGSTARSL